MPEENTATVDNATQGAPAEKLFTQAEVDAMMGERSKRWKAKYADYDEIKAKADKYDELAEASKSELEKAVEERDRLKAKLDKMEADAKRAEQVAKVAAEQGVDADMLSKMSGDPDENAQFLKQKMASAPKYGAVPDFGEPGSGAKASTAQQFADSIQFL